MYRIIDTNMLKDFKCNSCWIKDDLRDYEYNEETIESVNRVYEILEVMCKKYAEHIVIDIEILNELIIVPQAIYDCRFNIIVKCAEIEKVAEKLCNYRKKILGNTYSYQRDEITDGLVKEKENYKEMRELEKKCWEFVYGKDRFVTVYKQTRKWEDDMQKLFIENLQKVFYLGEQTKVITKNMVRLISKVYDFYVSDYLEDNENFNRSIENAYRTFRILI